MNYYNRPPKSRWQKFLDSKPGDWFKLAGYSSLVGAGCLTIIAIVIGMFCIGPAIGGCILHWIWPATFTFWQGFGLTLLLLLIFGSRVNSK